MTTRDKDEQAEYERADEFTRWAMDAFQMSYDAVRWADMQRQIDPGLPAELQAAIAERHKGVPDSRPGESLFVQGPDFESEWVERGSRDGE